MRGYILRLSFVLFLFIMSIGVGIVVTQQGGRVVLRTDQVAATAGVYDFTWSPDGKNIAYISLASGNTDIWIVPSTGGPARRLTSSSTLKKQPRWSADGKWIAFVELQTGNAGDIFIAGVDTDVVKNLTDTPGDERNPVWSPDSREIAFTQRVGTRNRIMVMDRETRSPRTVVEVAASELSWSPDGKTLLFTSDPLLTNDDRRENEDVFVIPAEGGAPRLLTPGTPRFRDFNGSWAPDSRQIVYASEISGYSNLYIFDIATGAKKEFATGKEEYFQPKWSPDGTNIAFIRDEDFRFHVWIGTVSTGRMLKVSDEDGTNGGFDLARASPSGTIAWSPDGKRLAFTHNDPGRTSDLWMVNADGSHSIQLSDSMPVELRRPGRFVWPEVMTYRSFDGEEVAALVYKPRGIKPKNGHPALLVFRDSLDGQLSLSWDPFIQLFVSNGYVVFAPNVRGSGGRGREFRQLVFQNGGDQDVRDAFIGLDRLSSEGLIDAQRVGIFGSGTGGFLATASLIKDEARFKAAVCLNGLVDATTASTYPGMGAWTRYLIGESPITRPLPYYERSLINFVDKLRTPILFFYSAESPLAASQQLAEFAVQAEVKGKWFDYRNFDNEAEGWQSWRPSTMRQVLDAMEALFDKYLSGHDREIRLTRNR